MKSFRLPFITMWGAIRVTGTDRTPSTRKLTAWAGYGRSVTAGVRGSLG
jgi:hypothetical protein